MKLGLDMDGVMYDFTRSWIDWCDIDSNWKRWGIPRPTDLEFHAWNDFERMGVTQEQFSSSCVEGVDAGFIFAVGTPIPGTKIAIENLRSDGHTIHIITHRIMGKKSVVNTMQWLNTWDIGFDTITFAENKTIVGVDLLLDDRDINYWASIEQGIPCVLMTRDWNTHVEDAPRVADWHEFEKYVYEFEDK